jgi:hypothetical protein
LVIPRSESTIATSGRSAIVAAIAASTTAPPAPAQQHLVVPASFATNDAPSFNGIAGASSERRQQTLVGPSHLTSLVGRSLSALELRRTAAAETYAGGSATLSVTLSIAPHATLACSARFADNVGPNAVQVFDGTVVLPTSPPTAGATVTWTPDNVVRVPFETAFVYPGGTLCVDIVGQPVAGQETNWWMADAVFEDIAGTVIDHGGGCGSLGGSAGAWSSVQERSLLAGGHARLFAYGTPLGLGLAAFGNANPIGIPLLSGIGLKME